MTPQRMVKQSATSSRLLERNVASRETTDSSRVRERSRSSREKTTTSEAAVTKAMKLRIHGPTELNENECTELRTPERVRNVPKSDNRKAPITSSTFQDRKSTRLNSS